MLDLISLHVQVLVLIDHLALVPTLFPVLLPADDLVAITKDPLERVVEHAHIHVSLCVNENLLFTLLIFKTPFIESLTAWRGIRFHVTLRLFVWQCVGWHLLGVV